MSKDNDQQPENPAAFPCTTGTDGGIFQEGLLMRDWFAGQALAGFCVQSIEYSEPANWVWEGIAADCYKAADAMLRERARTQQRANQST